MTPKLVQSTRSRRLLIAATVTAAILLLALGLEYESQVPDLAKADRQPVPTEGSSSTASTNPLALSVFEQPRSVPEIHFQDDQGHDLTLANFSGRVILLNIWATWCVPCRNEMPTLDRLALSIDRKGIEAIKDFYREVGVEKLAIYLDPSGEGSHDLAIPGVPTTLLINREGDEIARKLGEADWNSPEMVSLVERTVTGQSATNVGQLQ